MTIRTFALLAFTLVLVGTTSGSNSFYIVQFTAPEIESEILINAAIMEMENAGFHAEAPRPEDYAYQYQHYSMWAQVHSSRPSQIQFAFINLRGGCSYEKEVEGSRKIVSEILGGMETKFGDYTLNERHSANDRHPPNTLFD